MDYTKYKNYVPYEKMTKVDNVPEYLVVHCSDSDVDNFKSIQRYHITDPSRLYENVAYHYVIERGGSVVQGRPDTYHGGHVAEDGINRKSIGICICGSFENKLPDQNEINALKNILLNKMGEYSIPVEKIKPHRFWNKKKTCPGSSITDDWIKNLVKQDKLDDKLNTITTELVQCKEENKQYKSAFNNLLNYISTLFSRKKL